jgi:Flp pilus assembly protein TadG
MRIDFLRARSGNVAVITAFAMLPLIAAAGAVVDYSRSVALRESLQAGTDAAALAAAQYSASMPETDFDTKARAVMDTVFRPTPGSSVTSFDASRTSRSVHVEATASVPVTFLRYTGRPNVTVKAVSETMRGNANNVEVVLALDNTGSMSSNNKMTELKRSATNLINTLEASASRSGQVKIGIVPFATSVRVNPATSAPYRSASWIDFSGRVCYSLFGVNWCTNNEVDKASWKGCIQDRASPNNSSDAAPVTGNLDTLYPALQSCRTDEGNMVFVQPLTTDFAGLRAAVANMTPGGNTNVTIGVSWGLALLSNQTPFSEGAVYSEKTVQKFLIVLTDGENTQDRFDDCSSSSCVTRMNNRTKAACTAVKNAATGDQNKIKVYTVRMIDGDEDLLKACATDASTYFYDVRSATDLEPAFAAIANTIANLRLSQ